MIHSSLGFGINMSFDNFSPSKSNIHYCFKTPQQKPITLPPFVRQKMEPVGAITEGEWGSLGGLYSTEEADFMAQLLGNCSSFPNELDPTFWAGHESANESMYCSSDAAITNLYCFSQGSSSYSGGGGSSLFPNSSQGNYYLTDSQQVLGGINNAMSMDFSTGDGRNNSFAVQVFADSLTEGDEGNSLPEMPVPQPATEDRKNKKRIRNSGDVSYIFMISC